MPGCRRTCGRPRQARSRIFTGMAAGLASDLAGVHGVAEHGLAELVVGPIGDEAGMAAPVVRSRVVAALHPRLTGRAETRRHHLAAITCPRLQNRRRGGRVARGTKSISIESPRDVDRDRSERESTQSRRHACCKQIPTSSIALRSDGSSRDRRIRSAMFARTATNKSNNQKTEMLQRARAALPLTKIRERAFEGAFFSVALIAMAGWVYFITLLLVRLFLWFFN